MHKHSFEFGGVDMQEKHGVWITSYDVLAPRLRERKTIIPGRSGSYDFGAIAYEERTLRMVCDNRYRATRADMRELAYTLSKKNRIVLWDEPDKYYIGRIYDPSELTNLGEIVYKFTITFVCEPFAYGETVQVDFQGPVWSASYEGTQETPTRLQITNTGSTTANGIQITITEKRENF